MSGFCINVRSWPWSQLSLFVTKIMINYIITRIEHVIIIKFDDDVSQKGIMDDIQFCLID